MCYNRETVKKAYIHARLSEEDQSTLAEIKGKTGQSDSEIVRRGLQLVADQERRRRSALDLPVKAWAALRTDPAISQPTANISKASASERGGGHA